MEIRLSKPEELDKIIETLSNEVDQNLNADFNKVGQKLLWELSNISSYQNMIVFIAFEDNKILGISNGLLDNQYGISYHTISFSEGKGIGSQLFQEKIKYMLEKRGIVVAKPETKVGLELLLKNKFVKDKNFDNLLPWEGDAYILKSHV